MKLKSITRNICAFILIAVLLVGTAIVSVNAKTAGEYEYTVENGAATITKYNGNSENVIIPAEIDGYKVKSISFEAFRQDNCKVIKSVVVPEGVEEATNWLFTGCINMESITLPSTLKFLATDWFFIGSNNLKEIKFSKDNPRYYLDNGVLYDSENNQLMLCPAKKHFENNEYKILDGTADIRSWAFMNCTSLKKIVMPNSVQTIGDSAFSGCTDINEIVLSENINFMSFGSLDGLTSLKYVTIPKTLKGLYNGENSANTGLGFNGNKKLDDFTIRGYKNSEAEKYANDNGFRFIALDNQEDYFSFDPFEFFGKSFNEVTLLFGTDYTNVQERESGLHKIICYPNTGNPYEFGFDNNTDLVKIIWIYNTSDKSVKLFDDITDKSTLSDIENSSTSQTYEKWVGTNPFDNNNTEQYVTFKLDSGFVIKFEWTSNDFNTESANRVFIMKSDSEATVPTTQPDTTSSETDLETTKTPTASNDVTSSISTKDTASKDSTGNDNGTIQTGVVSTIIILMVALSALVIGGTAVYKRKIKE